jgi:hypothetical protein
MKGAVKLGIAAAVALAAGALLAVLYAGAAARGREIGCRNNLRQLGILAANNWALVDPSKTGRAFWQEVRVAVYRNINGDWKPILPDPFVCPVHGRTTSNRENAEAIDYRGPRKLPDEVRQYDKARPLGADRPSNHATGGWVLRLDTSVEASPPRIDRVEGADPLWAAASEALTD